MNDGSDKASIARRYDAIAYAAQSNALSHPRHLATVAALFGVDSPSVSRCRVLEVGCSDGSNLLPMAAGLPHAKLVGCDLSSRAVEAAQQVIEDTGLSNVQVLQHDLGSLPASLGDFDYIIAHGIYSWVPAPVRDALFELARTRLSDRGVMYVSLNVFPGCRTRQIAWDILRHHTQHIEEPRAKLDAARALCELLADGGAVQSENDQRLRDEFRRLSKEADSALFHDDLATLNHPVYFHEYAAHAAAYGLNYLADAKLMSPLGSGLAPRLQSAIGGLERLQREQYLDFAMVRRFRHSLLCRSGSASNFAFDEGRAKDMHASASTALVRAAAEGKALAAGDATPPALQDPAAATALALLQWLTSISPRSASMDDISAWLDERGRGNEAFPVDDAALTAIRARLPSMLSQGFVTGTIDLQLEPVALSAVVPDRPCTSVVTRWQAVHRNRVTNLRHETMTLKDALALRLLAKLDGRLDIDQLVEKVNAEAPIAPSTPQAREIVGAYLQQFAKHALLMPAESPNERA